MTTDPDVAFIARAVAGKSRAYVELRRDALDGAIAELEAHMADLRRSGHPEHAAALWELVERRRRELKYLDELLATAADPMPVLPEPPSLLERMLAELQKQTAAGATTDPVQTILAGTPARSH